MPIVLGILGLPILVVLYLLAIKPNRYREDSIKPFELVYIAHRGLFDNKNEIPENSLMAFRRAVVGGYGIELDVQLTKDNKLVVFHDANLKRMCGVNKKISECTYAQLKKYRLLGTEERIPLFSEALAVMSKDTPLLIEVKPYNKVSKTSETLWSYLKKYDGIYCIESFHPWVLHWFKKHHPEVARGQLSTNFMKNGSKETIFMRFPMTNLLLNFWGKPDFISYEHRFANSFSYRLCRKLYKVKNAGWTIHSDQDLNEAKKTFQTMIFDGFIPEQKEKLQEQKERLHDKLEEHKQHIQAG